jgi:hypothetical protein
MVRYDNVLLEYADWLESNVNDENFDFCVVRDESPCGTVGCAIGWVPAFDTSVSIEEDGIFNDAALLYSGKYYDYEEFAHAYFNLPMRDGYNLFTPNTQGDIGCG